MGAQRGGILCLDVARYSQTGSWFVVGFSLHRRTALPHLIYVKRSARVEWQTALTRATIEARRDGPRACRPQAGCESPVTTHGSP